MPPKRTCAQCGLELADDAPRGLCGQCLLSLGLDEAAGNGLTRNALEAEARTRSSRDHDQATEHIPVPPTPVPGANGSIGVIRYFGDYELLEEIARGGMGVVYKARQVSLQRIVAVKMILGGHLARKDLLHRFRQEAQAAANLQHPNIVAIHEVGEHAGQHYFSMDYVEGRNLAETVADLRGKPVDPRWAARWLKSIAEAVHYAHEQGTIHRDLKPSNILIDQHDQPRITDFGLAKSLKHESELTRSGQVMGTPGYMPPEQASGSRQAIGPASDVYGLGAVLYFMLAARPPFVGDTLEAILSQVLHQDPVSPRSLNPSIPRDVETICLKCLEKEPRRRYASAQEMAEELGRFLESRPILARPLGPTGKVWRWCRRKPVVAGLSAGLVLALVLGFAGVTWQWRQTERERQLQRCISYGSSARAAQLALQQDDRGTAIALLEPQRPEPGDGEDLRGVEWRYLWQESRSDEIRSIPQPHIVWDAALSPNGRLVATYCLDHKIRIWDSASGDKLHEFTGLPFLSPRKCFGFSPDGACLVMPGSTTGIEIRETTTWKVIKHLSPAQPPLCLSADGKFVVAVGSDLSAEGPGLAVWNLSNGSQQRLAEASALYRNLAIAPDGTRIAYSTAEPYLEHRLGAIVVHDLQSGRAGMLATNESTVSLAISPDGKWLVSGHYASGEICFWNLATRQAAVRFTAHQGPAVALAFSPDSRMLASGGYDRSIHLWETGTSKKISTLYGHRNSVIACAFSQDGQTLMSAGPDRTARLWHARAAPSKSRTFAVPKNTLPFGALPDGSALVAREIRGTTTYLLRLPEGNLIRSNNWDHVGRYGCPKPWFFVRNRAVMGVSTNGTAHFWDLTTGEHLRSVSLGDSAFRPEFLSPDNRWILGPSGSNVMVFDLQEGRATLKVSMPRFYFLAAGFSHDSRWLAYAAGANVIRVWDLLANREKATLRAPGHGAMLVAIRFSPDGKVLATGGWDGLWLWSVKSGKPLHALTLEGVNNLSFSADGRTLAASAANLSIRCWSVATGQELLSLPNAALASGDLYPNLSADWATQAELNPGGNLLVWHEGKGLIRVTRLPTLAEIDTSEQSQRTAQEPIGISGK